MRSSTVIKSNSKKALAPSKSKDPKPQASFDFFGEVKQEFKKVTWTSRDELKAYTKIVVLATFISGMLLYLLDLFVKGTLDGLGGLVRLITG